MKRIVVAGIAIAVLASAAVAQSGMMHKSPAATGQHGQSGGHAASSAHKGDRGASSLAFAAANRKMHEDMDIAFTGDADTDFMRSMIAHHQGAIDMAKIVLAFGKDGEVKKLAGEIIRAQESEIATMRDWLKKNGK